MIDAVVGRLETTGVHVRVVTAGPDADAVADEVADILRSPETEG